MALCSIALSDGGRGLAVESGAPVLQDAAPAQWRVESIPGKYPPWLKVSAETEGGRLCLDLSNPDQQPTLSDDGDVSGQHWAATSQMGCKELEGGAVARCMLGYKLHTMWTGSELLLTATADGLEMKPDGEDGQVWEIKLEDGNVWMPSEPAVLELEVAEPELAVCDFGHPQVEVLEVAEPEIAVCHFAPPQEEFTAELVPEMICGGLAPPQEGGPTELLEELRPQIEAQAQASGWNGMFTHFEPVCHRTQVVAGLNYFCKVRVKEDVYAHVTIYQPLPGQGPPELSSCKLPKTADDPL
mmetsp:Transcript_19428/g.60992  ORF Transcript_19428/g.60992 Transcript_19428/m.60992 type:complete len:299 (+) Transcript_19428:92-988(+)